jgi:hypothetical protein
VFVVFFVNFVPFCYQSAVPILCLRLCLAPPRCVFNTLVFLRILRLFAATSFAILPRLKSAFSE